MMNLQNMVCKNIDVQYSADGALQMLPDGTPKYTRLTMTLAERTMITGDLF